MDIDEPAFGLPSKETLSIPQAVLAPQEESEYFEIEQIMKHKILPTNKIMLFIKWNGYDEAHNTWEPLSTFYNDASELVNEYFKS
jgi:hypothetical protein